MTRFLALGLLLLAAILEAGGDALIRIGLRHRGGSGRSMMLVAGAIFLFVYGVVVNAPDWDFGRLLGIYVVFFFAVAQLIGWIVFHQQPSSATVAGGALIVAGGVLLAVANT